MILKRCLSTFPIDYGSNDSSNYDHIVEKSVVIKQIQTQDVFNVIRFQD